MLSANCKAVLWTIVLSTAVAGQTVSPVISEYSVKARGAFSVTNSSLFPLNVVLSAESFTVDSKGDPKYRDLDADIHLRLSRTSFRLAPNQTYTVSYTATAEHLPAWFSVYSSCTDASGKSDVKLVTQLPHTIYLLPKEAVRKDLIRVSRAELVAPGKVKLEINNEADQWVRIKQIEISSATGKKVTSPGFPLFPQQARQAELDWTDQDMFPQRVVLDFGKFKIDAQIDSTKSK